MWLIHIRGYIWDGHRPYNFPAFWLNYWSISEGKTLEECRKMLHEALYEMMAAYHEQKKRNTQRKHSSGTDTC